MPFGITLESSANPLASIAGLELKTYTETPRSPEMSDAPDEEGNTVARTVYGGDASIKTCTATYLFKGASGAALTGSVVLGCATGSPTYWVESLTVETSSGSWPQISCTWRTGLSNVSGPKFTIPLPAILPLRKAQAIGVSVSNTTVAKLSSTSATWTVEYADDTGEDGAFACAAFYNCTATSEASAVAITAAPTFAAATGWTLTTLPGISENATEYGESSATASKFVEPDAAAA